MDSRQVTELIDGTLLEPLSFGVFAPQLSHATGMELSITVSRAAITGNLWKQGSIVVLESDLGHHSDLVQVVEPKLCAALDRLGQQVSAVCAGRVEPSVL